MKCINRSVIIKLIAVIFAFCFLNGCKGGYVIPYDVNNSVSALTFGQNNTKGSFAPAFSKELCVASSDIIPQGFVSEGDTSEGLFCVTKKQSLAAKKIHERRNPASITKIMTAYIAIKYGHPEDTLIATENVIITEPGAQVIPLKAGDRMNLDQALHALIMYSANDVAVMIAEYISGSVERFAELMNEEALSLGATNTHFVNPNGLTHEDHHTTAYDLYLIFNEAIKYEKFVELISTMEYNLVYSDSTGAKKELSLSTKNQYLTGESPVPSGMTVIGGKTGTTKAAGNCLILLSRDFGGNSYISIVLNATDLTDLYSRMTALLSLSTQAAKGS